MRKGITAAELMAHLEADPEFVARRKERAEKLRKREQELRRAEAPLVEELRAAGLEVDSAWDFVNTSRGYSRALPILLRHLKFPYPIVIREGIARALGVPDAAFAWPELVHLFRSEQEKRLRDGLAVAICNIAVDDEKLDQLIALAHDSRLGSSRVLLLWALERSRLPKAQKALVELSSDPQLKLEIESIFRRQRDREKRRLRRKKQRMEQNGR